MAGKFLSQNIWREKFWQINMHSQFYLIPFDVEVMCIIRNAVYVCGGIYGTCSNNNEWWQLRHVQLLASSLRIFAQVLKSIKYPNNGPLFPDSRRSNIGVTLVLALSITDDGTALLNDLFGSGNFLSVFR